MKIYLADTVQREHLNYHQKFPVANHLESYFSIISKKTDISKWHIFQRNNHASFAPTQRIQPIRRSWKA